MPEVNKYRILDYELVSVCEIDEDPETHQEIEEYRVLQNPYSMFYSIDEISVTGFNIKHFPSLFHYVVLDKEFSKITGTLGDTVTISTKKGDTDLRATNFILYDWNNSEYSSQTTDIRTEDEGLLFCHMTYDNESDDKHSYIKYGNGGCCYAKKTSRDYQYAPLTRISNFITVITNGTDYKLYYLNKINSNNTVWKVLYVPKYKSFWQESNWTTDASQWTTLNDIAEEIYKSMDNTKELDPSNPSVVMVTPPVKATVNWSIYSYDVDSENKLRNFVADEVGSNYFRNKYTNSNPITMCKAVPLNDTITFKEADSDDFYISSSKNSYILFDYRSSDTEIYPLYSPEILEEYGIAFVRSDWLFYDADHNLRVEFYPEKASNLLYNEDGTALKTYTHSVNNPLIGYVKSWKDIYGITEDPASDGSNYDYMNTNKYVNYYMKNRSFVAHSFRWFTGNQRLTSSKISIAFDSNGKPTRICKPSWNWALREKNFGDVEKHDPQMVFTFIVMGGKPMNDTAPIDNVGVWVNKEEYGMECLCYFDDYRSYTQPVTYETTSTPFDSAIATDQDKFQYFKPITVANNTLLTYMDDENQPVLKYERWRYILQYVYAEDNPAVWINQGEANPSVVMNEEDRVYHYDTTINTKSLYNVQKKIQTVIRKYSPADEDAEQAIEEKKQEAGWMTPNEYYNSSVDTSKVDTGALGYSRAASISDEIKGNWFWVDELKNWCIWRRVNAAFLNLYVWNGRNDWDSLEDIINALYKMDLQTLKRVYYYNPDVFSIGPLNASFSTFCNTTDNTKPAWMAENVWLSIILKRDTRMSTYDSETFQNIHSSSILYNRQQAVVIPGDTRYSSGDKIGKLKTGYGAIVMPTVGCPCIVRNTTGQLNLMYKFKTDGNFKANDTTQTNLYFKDEGVTYLNSVCKTYFGTGDEYTIKNWKKFNMTNWDEEKEGKILTGAEESLYGVPPIVNSKAETINMNIEMTVPRPNISTKSIENEDYILRWNR